MELLIQNGMIINADGSQRLDIRCVDGKIVEMSPGIKSGKGHKLIDATGCLVLPGGIDPHVHMQLPTAAGTSSDDFYSGSVAALMGGTTTLIDFVTPEKGQSLSEAIGLRKTEATVCVIDHSFHVSPVEWQENMPEQIRACVQEEGLRSFKVYMAYKQTIGLDDEDLFKVMEAVSESNGILAVHSEMGDEIEKLRKEYGNSGKLAPKYHALSRPDHTEAKAVERLVGMVERTNCTVYIVHVSAAMTLDIIKRAQDNGLPVYAETCPQYLFLDDSKYEEDLEEAIKFVMSPPLRKKKDNKALWSALASGLINTVGTDHCPFTLAQKISGKNDFRTIPNGAGGVQHRMELLFTYGVLENRINMERFVALTSTNAAKIFGLFPAKGQIAEGSDADIVIWDQEIQSMISARNHYQNCDFNIYEGLTIQGKPRWVIANGQILLEQGVLNLKDHKGRFLQTNAF